MSETSICYEIPRKKSPRYNVQYPSPTASMMSVGDMVQAQYSGNNPRRPTYEQARRMWPAARSPDSNMRSGHDDVPPPQGDGVEGQLNPSWMEWLMGWPPGWTGEMPLSTEQVRAWREKAASEALWDGEPPDVSRTGRNIPNRNARLKAVGNGQVPSCAARAYQILTEAEERLREVPIDQDDTFFGW